MSPDEIRTLDPDAMIFISDTQDPALLQKTPLFLAGLDLGVDDLSDDSFLSLASQDPMICSWPLVL